MNVAFVLVTSAWLAGADAADKPADKAAPVAAAPVAGSHGCGSSCDSCCEESWGNKLLGRLRGMFRRDDCCESSCHTASSCDSCGWREKLRGRFHRDCGCATTHNTCDSCESSLFAKLRAKFRRHDDCCDSCNTCGTAAAPAAGGPKEELKTPPREKPLPSGEKKEGETRLIVPQPLSPATGLTIGQ